jgi:ribosomal protein S18 acetylase RimI-like enzyme
MVTIQQATADDLATIRKLAYAIWPVAYGDILSAHQLQYMLGKFYSLSSLEHQFTFSKHKFIIALDDTTPIGFASFSPHQDDHTIFHLNKLYVLPDYQGQKIGQLLLDFIISEIKNSGATSLQLNVNRNNKAIHFYEKQDFTIIRKEDIDIGEGYFMNDFVMEKKV